MDHWTTFYLTIYLLSDILFSLSAYKDEEMIELLRRLHDCLEKEQYMQYDNDQNLAKNLILKSIFSLIHSANETLLLHVLQIILLVRISFSSWKVSNL